MKFSAGITDTDPPVKPCTPLSFVKNLASTIALASLLTSNECISVTCPGNTCPKSVSIITIVTSKAETVTVDTAPAANIAIANAAANPTAISFPVFIFFYIPS